VYLLLQLQTLFRCVALRKCTLLGVELCKTATIPISSSAYRCQVVSSAIELTTACKVRKMPYVGCIVTQSPGSICTDHDTMHVWRRSSSSNSLLLVKDWLSSPHAAFFYHCRDTMAVLQKCNAVFGCTRPQRVRCQAVKGIYPERREIVQLTCTLLLWSCTHPR
jgi:hypothetical protein